MRIGLIGYGAIGSRVHAFLGEEGETVRLVAVLARPSSAADIAARVPMCVRVATDWSAFAKAEPEVVVECAGHAALHEFGPDALARGCTLVVSSVGALADAGLEHLLREAAARGGGRIVIPSGAAGGLDALAAARRSGTLERVCYTGRKAPRAWRGTAAADRIDLDNLAGPARFFEGDARAAALAFPQNANVVAAIALAGAGFEKTEVSLVADPDASGNSHTLEATGLFGTINASVTAAVLPDNPKTSMLAPASIAHSILRLSDWIVV